MNIQKEVYKFEAKKSKLVNDFTARIANFINSKVDDNLKIRDIKEDLSRLEAENLDTIEEASKALKGIK